MYHTGKFFCWLVVWGLESLGDSISVYLNCSQRKGKRKEIGKVWEKIVTQPTNLGTCLPLQIRRTSRHWALPSTIARPQPDHRWKVNAYLSELVITYITLLLFSFLGESQNCGGILNSTSGSIVPPDTNIIGYYDDNLNCIWTIKAESNRVVQLTFGHFDVEPHEKCYYDYLRVSTIWAPTSKKET